MSYSYVDEAYREIDRGLTGGNRGLSTGCKRLDSLMGNIQRSHYYLLGGDTGSGKSALGQQIFIIEPLMEIKRLKLPIKPVWDLFSLEMKDKINVLRWIPYFAWKYYQVDIPFKKIIGAGNNRLTSDELKIVNILREELEEIEKLITIYDSSLTPDEIKGIINRKAQNYGEFKQISIIKDGHTESQVKYFPYDSEHWYFIMIDHAARVKGSETKKKIDAISDVLVESRNVLGATGILIQQLSRTIASTDLRKLMQIEPQLSDFKDSGNSQHDADVVMALAHPFLHNIGSYRGYQVLNTKGMKDGLKNSFRGIHLLKDRFGAINIFIPFFYLGKCYSFIELPRLDVMPGSEDKYPPMKQTYQKYKDMEYLKKLMAGTLDHNLFS